MLLFNGHDYKDNLWEVFMIWHGGIAIYGALIGAIIGTSFYIRAKGYNFLRIADIVAPGSDCWTNDRSLGQFHESGSSWGSG